jgi:hypothetical protein
MVIFMCQLPNLKRCGIPCRYVEDIKLFPIKKGGSYFDQNGKVVIGATKRLVTFNGARAPNGCQF